MSAPVVAPHHEPTTGGQVIMLFVFGASFVVMVIWQVLIYLSAYFPALLPKRPALAVAEEGESDEKEKERRELQIAIDQPSTWASVLHNEEWRQALHAFCSLGGLMLIFYLLDGPSPIFPQGERTYNRDQFIFVLVIILLAALLCIVPCQNEKIMQRDLTDEWKGWMQIVFILYHYFAAKETYNIIRNLIAGYVFLTGFGNYSFFYVKGDFGFKRVIKMLFRLNFLVAMIAITLNKSYMLYYICALHTWWFLVVYGTMAIYGSYNQNNTVAAIKFGLLFLFITFLYDAKPIFELVFFPFRFLLSYEGSLHEWWFRSGLDRYATLWGMMCAHFHPNYEAAWNQLEQMPFVTQWAIKGAIAAAVGGVMHWWLNTYLIPLDKYTYNAVHPYVSVVPILSYILLRNLAPRLRAQHTWLFAFIGKISLESYLSQFHVWLGSDAKTVIWLIPDYPMINFVVASGIFLAIAHLLFQITQTLNDFILPQSAPNRVFLRNFIVLAAFIAVMGFAEHLQNLARGYLPDAIVGNDT